MLVARRSALEMVAKACTVDGDVNLWIRVPRDTQTIEEAMLVYGLLRVFRDKCPSDPAPALEAAIAERGVVVMMAASTYPSCEHALQDIAVPSEEQHLSMSEFRSQILMAQSSTSRVATCISSYDKEIRQIYRVP